MFTFENNTYQTEQKIKLSGALSGIDALHFRDKTATIIQIMEGELQLDVDQLSQMDLTGFNSIVMLKKEAMRRNIRLIVRASTGNPIHEYIHLSKLSFECVNSSNT